MVICLIELKFFLGKELGMLSGTEGFRNICAPCAATLVKREQRHKRRRAVVG